jgi:hypothetical protein
VVNATSRPLYPRAWPNTNYTGSWMISRAGLYCTENVALHRESIPGQSSP